MDRRIEQMKHVQEEALDLFKRKNSDYGDAFAQYGPVGVIIRIGDKINRASRITKTGVTLVNTETLRDTLVDLHNYAAMAVFLMDEKFVMHGKVGHPRVSQIKSECRRTGATEWQRTPNRAALRARREEALPSTVS